MMYSLALDGGPPAVPPLSFRRWPFYSTKVAAAIVERVVSGNLYATEIDPLIEGFEERFTQRLCPGYKSIFCSTGTAALSSAYFALGLDPGAEVLVPTNTFRATVTPLLLLNLRPVLCDSDSHTGTIDLDHAESKITSRTQALVVTHIWGHPADLKRACRISKKYGLALVEDCSHAHGATFNGKPVGTFGDVSVFSLGTKKMISGGLAGMLVTKTSRIYERALLFGQPKPRGDIELTDPYLREFLGTGLGANFRGSPLAAVLANEHLERLPSTISVKNANLLRLADALNRYLPDLCPPSRKKEFTSGTWYAFQCSWRNQEIRRDILIAALKAEGVSVTKPTHLLHNERLFYDFSPLSTFRFRRRPRYRKHEYLKSELLFDQIIGWETRELYEPANEIVDSYALAFEKISRNLRRLVKLSESA